MKYIKIIVMSIFVLCFSIMLVYADYSKGIVYTIQESDTISSIAQTYNLPEEFVRNYNNIDNSIDISNQKVMTKAWEYISELIIVPLFGNAIDAFRASQIEINARESSKSLLPLLLQNNNDITQLTQSMIDMNTSSASCGHNNTTSTFVNNLESLIIVNDKSTDILWIPPSLSAFEDIYDDVDTIQSSWYQKWYGAWWFAPWYCTDYAAFRRPDLFILKDGKYRPFGWDAKDWYWTAKKAWFMVWKSPRKWAIAVFYGRGVSREYGHVAFVEKVSSDGKIMITDMNYKWKNIVTRRIISSSDPIGYIY